MINPKATVTLVNTLADCLRQGNFVRLVLSSPVSAPDCPERISARLIDLQGRPHVSLIRQFATQSATENLSPSEAPNWLRQELPNFRNALLCTTTRDWQWHADAEGRTRLVAHPPSSTRAPSRQHDQPKQRILDETARDWLQGLGVLNHQGKPRAEMGDKYRQIQCYLEIVARLARQCGWIRTAASTNPGPEATVISLPEAEASPSAGSPAEWVLADMGCGKAYLTFGLWHLLRRTWSLPARIVGVETRANLVAANQRLARQIGAEGLEFIGGNIASTALPPLRALIALHACDTATDDAIHRGIERGAQLIVVAPCCHKELRPRLAHPEPLAAVLQHGIMEERLAEWVTDGLRALRLEAAGYRTKILEFVSSEHTPKNLMIAAIRHGSGINAAARLQLAKMQSFFGLEGPVAPSD